MKLVLNENKKVEEKIDRKDLIYETNIHIIQQFEAMRSFGDSIFSGKITLDKTDKKPSNLANNISQFNSRARPYTKVDKE